MPSYLDVSAIFIDLQRFHTDLQVIGVIGSFTYVCGFFLVQAGRICGNGIVYPLNQTFSACCVLTSLITAFNLAAFLIQTSFILIALYGIWLRVTGRYNAKHGAGASPHPHARSRPQGLSLGAPPNAAQSGVEAVQPQS